MRSPNSKPCAAATPAWPPGPGRTRRVEFEYRPRRHPGLPRRLRRPPRPRDRPDRTQDRDRTLHPAGRAGHDQRALRLRAPGVLDRRQRLLPPRLALDRPDAQQAWPTATLVHLPVHASWLNQIEIYFSILQRKAITPSRLHRPRPPRRTHPRASRDRYNHDRDPVRLALHPRRPQRPPPPSRPARHPASSNTRRLTPEGLTTMTTSRTRVDRRPSEARVGAGHRGRWSRPCSIILNKTDRQRWVQFERDGFVSLRSPVGRLKWRPERPRAFHPRGRAWPIRPRRRNKPQSFAGAAR